MENEVQDINKEAELNYKVKVENEAILRSPHLEFMAGKQEEKPADTTPVVIAPWMVAEGVDVSGFSDWEKTQNIHPDFLAEGTYTEFTENYIDPTYNELNNTGNEVIGVQVGHRDQKNSLLMNTYKTLGPKDRAGDKGERIRQAMMRNKNITDEKISTIKSAYDLDTVPKGELMSNWVERVGTFETAIDTIDTSLSDYDKWAQIEIDKDPSKKEEIEQQAEAFYTATNNAKSAIKKKRDDELFSFVEEDYVGSDTLEFAGNAIEGVVESFPDTVNNVIQLFTELSQARGFVDADFQPFQFEGYESEENKNSLVYGFSNILGQFVTPYIGSRTALSKVGPWSKEFLSAGLADSLLDPEEGGVIHALNLLNGDDDSILAYMDATPDKEDGALQRLKQRAVQAGEGAVFTVAIAGAWAIKQLGFKDAFKKGWLNTQQTALSTKQYITTTDKAVKKLTGADLFANRVQRLNKQAQTMDYFEVDPKKIWDQTNMVKAPDGTWQFDIDLSDATFNIKPGEFNLDTVLQSDQLSSLIPGIGKTKVKIIRTKKGQGRYAFYDSASNTITLKTDATLMIKNGETFSEEGADLLIHEIQHVAQTIAERPAGGSIHMFKPGLVKKRNKFLEKIADTQSNNKAWKKSQSGEELTKADHNSIKKMNQAIYKIEMNMAAQGVRTAGDVVNTSTGRYLNLSGEYEARMVASRRGLTFSQRKNLMPYYPKGLTTSYPTDEALVRASLDKLDIDTQKLLGGDLDQVIDFSGTDVKAIDEPLKVLTFVEIAKNESKFVSLDGVQVFDVSHNGKLEFNMFVEDIDDKVFVSFEKHPKASNRYPPIKIEDVIDKKSAAILARHKRQYSSNKVDEFVAEISTLPKKQRLILLGRQIGKSTDNVERQALIRHKKDLESQGKTSVITKAADKIEAIEFNDRIYSKLQQFAINMDDNITFKNWEELEKALIKYGVRQDEIYASQLDKRLNFLALGYPDKGAPLVFDKYLIGLQLAKRSDEVTKVTLGDGISGGRVTWEDIDFNSGDVNVGDSGYGTIVRHDDTGIDREIGEIFDDDYFVDEMGDDIGDYADMRWDWFENYYDGSADDVIIKVEGTKWEESAGPGKWVNIKTEAVFDNQFDGVIEVIDEIGDAPWHDFYSNKVLYTDGYNTWNNIDDAVEQVRNELVEEVNEGAADLWENYTLPHGDDKYSVDLYMVDNFRPRLELGHSAGQLPTDTQRAHWGDAADSLAIDDAGKVAVHTRSTFRTGGEFIEELQSDWAQDYGKANQIAMDALRGSEYNSIAEARAELKTKRSIKMTSHDLRADLGEKYSSDDVLANWDAGDRWFIKNERSHHSDILSDAVANWSKTLQKDKFGYVDGTWEEFVSYVKNESVMSSRSYAIDDKSIKKFSLMFDREFMKSQRGIIAQHVAMEGELTQSIISLDNIVQTIPTPPMTKNSQYVRMVMLDKLVNGFKNGDKWIGWADADVHSNVWRKLPRGNIKYVEKNNMGGFMVTMYRRGTTDQGAKVYHEGTSYTKSLSRSDLVEALNETKVTEIEKALREGESAKSSYIHGISSMPKVNTGLGVYEPMTDVLELTDAFATHNGMVAQYDEVMVNVVHKITGQKPHKIAVRDEDGVVGRENSWRILLTDDVRKKIMETMHVLYK
jgi:hypothetical protein